MCFHKIVSCAILALNPPKIGPVHFHCKCLTKKSTLCHKYQLSITCIEPRIQVQTNSLTPSVAVTVKSKLSDPSSRSKATLVQICPVSLLMVNWLGGALAGPDPIEYVMAPNDPPSASSAFTYGAQTQRTLSELW